MMKLPRRAAHSITIQTEFTHEKGGFHMFDFNYFTPTPVVFGRNTEQKVSELIRRFGGTKGIPVRSPKTSSPARSARSSA